MPVELGRRQLDGVGVMVPETGAQPWDASWDNMGRPSLITDHAHDAPRPWERCSACGLGEAAHAERLVRSADRVVRSR